MTTELVWRRAEDRAVLLRLAGELAALADQTDAHGRPEGPGLRDDAGVLRRLAGDLGNTMTIATTPYDGPLTTTVIPSRPAAIPGCSSCST